MKSGNKTTLSTENICRGCSSRVVDAVKHCPVCNAPFHKSCSERCSVLPSGGFSKCCGSRPPSPCLPPAIGLDDINRVVQSALQSAIGTIQNDIGSLQTNLSQDYHNVLDSVKSLENKFDGFEAKFEGLTERVAGNENAIKHVSARIQSIEGTLDSIASNKHSYLDEMERRNSRKRNLILFGLPEERPSNNPGGSTSVVSPTDNVQRYLQSVLPPRTLPTLEAFRLGKPSLDPLKPRPLKICCQDPLAAQSLLSAFLSATKGVNPSTKGVGTKEVSHPSGTAITTPIIRMTPDRTVLQLQQIRELKEVMKTRQLNGEEDLRLVFRDNVPVIVSARPQKA